MIERNERKPYWRHTKVQMLTSLLPFVLAMIVLPLYADALNDKRILGIPLGYFLACHGLIVIAFVTIAVFVNRQDAIDHWHGGARGLLDQDLDAWPSPRAPGSSIRGSAPISASSRRRSPRSC